jgi:hypothetical protein
VNNYIAGIDMNMAITFINREKKGLNGYYVHLKMNLSSAWY